METLSDNSNHEPLTRTSYFRFYEELNDFLPVQFRKKQFPFNFTGIPSVKNTIEAIGVPHVEIDLILIDGRSVNFDYLILGGEKISVYPVFETFDISSVLHLRPKPLRITKFVVDVNLGKLAHKLRLLGFDTLYRNDYEDDEIVNVSVQEKRIILTRDKSVLKYSKVRHGFWLRSDDPKTQLNEIIERLQLQHRFSPFTRCSNCNGSFEKVDKIAIRTKVPRDTFAAFDEFWRCKGCEKIYWQGTHFAVICSWVEKLRGK